MLLLALGELSPVFLKIHLYADFEVLPLDLLSVGPENEDLVALEVQRLFPGVHRICGIRQNVLFN